MRRFVWAFAFLACAAGAQAQTTVSGPVTFGTGLSVSGSGTVSVATGGVSNAMLVNPGLTLGSTAMTLGATTTSVSGLALSGASLTGTTTLPGGTVTSTGLVGIGVNATGGSGGPSAPLVVDSANNPLAAGFGSLIIQGNANKERIDVYSAGTSPGPALQGKGFGGTVTSPTATVAGNDLFVFGGSGYNGSNFILPNPVTITFVATDNWSPTDNSAYMTFTTTPPGSVSSGRVERMRITAGGLIGIGTTTPGYLLDVQGGQVNASGGFAAAGTSGVTCSGVPTAAFAVIDGIVTHC